MTEQTRDQDAILARYADGPAQLEAAIAGVPMVIFYRGLHCPVCETFMGKVTAKAAALSIASGCPPNTGERLTVAVSMFGRTTSIPKVASPRTLAR